MLTSISVICLGARSCTITIYHVLTDSRDIDNTLSMSRLFLICLRASLQNRHIVVGSFLFGDDIVPGNGSHHTGCQKAPQ